jgi:HD-GYP domain-containing protein (c-di-GMP phosphodiesterase class II)
MGDDGRLLALGDVAVGLPLAWDVLNESGQLLVRKGMVLRSDQQIKRLFKHTPLFAKDDLDVDELSCLDVISPFAKLDLLAEKLELVFKAYAGECKTSRRRHIALLPRLAKYLVNLCHYDLDAVLGAAHHQKHASYAVSHSLHTASLCFAIAKFLNLSERHMVSLVGAALSCNLGMYPLQDRLVAQKGGLTPAQKRTVQEHCVQSAVLLKHNGIEDQRWLDAVLQHHENVDGSGYPAGLTGDKISILAKIVALADRYHAMVVSRKFRKGMLPTAAIKHLVRKAGRKEVDHKLAVLFVKAIGIYPPGSTVLLANADIAVVTRCSDEAEGLVEVKALYDRELRPYKDFPPRDVTDDTFAILRPCELPLIRLRDFKAVWDYHV